MKRIPKTFDLFCAIWDIEQPKTLFDEEDRQLLGQCNMDDTVIEVAREGVSGKKLKARDRWESLWHEIFEALNYTLHHDARDRWSHTEIDILGRAVAQITWTMKY